MRIFYWQYRAFLQAGVLAFVAYLAWQGWTYLGPRKPEVGPLRQQVADQVIEQVTEDIRRVRQAAPNLGTTALLHLVNDPSDYVTDRLRAQIEQNGVLNLLDRTFWEKVRNLLRLSHTSYGNLETALQQGRKLKADTVLFGSVGRFESGAADAVIDLELTLARTSDGAVLLTKRYGKEMTVGLLSQPFVQEQVQALRPAQRFLAWVVIVLMLPIFTIGFIRAMVRKESNKVNAFTLGTYTAVDALLAYILLGAALTGWFSVLLFLIAVGAAFAYNYTIMSFALKLET